MLKKREGARGKGENFKSHQNLVSLLFMNQW